MNHSRLAHLINKNEKLCPCDFVPDQWGIGLWSCEEEKKIIGADTGQQSKTTIIIIH